MYPVSLLDMEEFKESNLILEGKARDLRDRGMGNRPNRALPITKREEEILWECGQLGCNSAQSLINTLWWLLTQHFGLRGRQEHYPMLIEDLQFGTDDEGLEYVTLSEKRTKTRQGGLSKRERGSSPKVFAIGGERCFVNLLSIFKSKRPPQLRDCGYFYLQVINKPTSTIWYKTSRMGQNTIGEIMKNMKVNSPLKEICPDKKITNHSARKTVVKKLQRQGVQRSDIITVTGHTSEKGLDSYDEGDEQQQRVISHIIDGIADQGTTQSLTTSSNETQKENNEVALQTGFHPQFQKVVQRSPLSRCSFNTPRAPALSASNHLVRQQQHPAINQFNPYLSGMTRQPPVQQIFNISNCNITMSISAYQQQQKRPGLDSYDPLAEINFDMDLFPDLLDI